MDPRDDDRPRLRVVRADEVAPSAAPDTPPVVDPEPEDDTRVGRWEGSLGGIAAVLVGLAVLLVGLAVSLDILLGDDGSDGTGGTDGSASAVTTTPGSTIDPRVLIPLRSTTTVAGATTAPAEAPSPSDTPTTTAVDRSLVSVPLAGGPVATAPLPTTGSVRVRLFNGFLPGVPLDVWDVASSPPLRYGTVGYGQLAEIVAGGRLLPNGVELRLRFVRPGGDPSAPSDPTNGPWQWNLTPADASAQTLVVVPNPGFRVVRIDDRRAAGDVRSGQVHVVPVVVHLVRGSRTLPWATDAGCLGPVSTDDVELDLPPASALRLAAAGDPSCASTAAGPTGLPSSGAVAVVALDDGPDPWGPARLVALPLG